MILIKILWEEKKTERQCNVVFLSRNMHLDGDSKAEHYIRKVTLSVFLIWNSVCKETVTLL